MKLPAKSFEKHGFRFQADSANKFTDVKTKKPRWFYLLGVASLVLAGGIGAWTWQGPYQSWQDRNEVEKAMAVTDPGLAISTWEKLERQNLEKNPEPVRLYLTSEFLKNHRPKERGNALALDKAAHAALREAARQGSDLAALELVKLQRASPSSNFNEISKQLDKIQERVQLGVKVGDPTSMYTLAVMKSEGLGTAVDMTGAAELVRRAAKDLPLGLQEDVMVQAANGSGIFKDEDDESLAEYFGTQLLKRKYYSHSAPCPGISVHVSVNTTCYNAWIRASATAGNPIYFSDFAGLLLRHDDKDLSALEWFKKAPEDTLSTYGSIIVLFSELLENKKIPVHLHELLSRKDILAVLKKDAGDDFILLANSLSALEIGRIDGDVGIVKIVAVYRGLLNFLAWWEKDATVSAVTVVKDEELPRWMRLLNNPRIVSAGDALSAALESGNGLSEALKQIDMLDQPAPAPIPQAKPAWAIVSMEPIGPAPAPIQQAKPAQPEVSDKDYRAKSGPIGSQSASGGLSSFTVDNSQGDQDVVVRLYRDGKLPAVRSFIVKKGDTYAAEKITAGNYVMRHRHIDSDKTYEANEVFRLAEIRLDDGIQYSRMRVTMFKVQDGNLTNREVPPDQF